MPFDHVVLLIPGGSAPLASKDAIQKYKTRQDKTTEDNATCMQPINSVYTFAAQTVASIEQVASARKTSQFAAQPIGHRRKDGYNGKQTVNQSTPAQ